MLIKAFNISEILLRLRLLLYFTIIYDKMRIILRLKFINQEEVKVFRQKLLDIDNYLNQIYNIISILYEI